jgi:hypothetical protein
MGDFELISGRYRGAVAGFVDEVDAMPAEGRIR